MEKKELKALFEELTALLESRHMKELKAYLEQLNEVDVAAFLEELPQKELAMLFRLLSKEQAAEVFAHLDIDRQEHIINSITDAELSDIIEELYVDDAVDLLEELPSNVVKRVMRNAKGETRALINQFLKYPENSAGSIMTAEFIDLKKGMSVGQSFDRIRKVGAGMETIYTCFVTSADRKLEGVVTVKDLLLTDYDKKIAEIMDGQVVFAVTTDDQEEVAELFSKYDLLIVPVVDHERRLVGIVTVDDVLDVIEKEATEDIEKMAAIVPTEKPYMKNSVFELWKARIPWLLLLMISATFTGMIITGFEAALEAYVALTAFIPMLMDTAGNSGSQSSVTIIRGMSLNEIAFRDLFKVLWKEMQVAVLCGVTLAAANFVKLMLFDRVSVPVALVVCLTLVVTVFAAKTVGCLLPMLSKRLGFDPAVMSSPFITTIVDAISLLIYFQFATVILHI